MGGDDPGAGGFAAAATKRVKAATKRQFQTIASTVVSKKRQKMDDVSSLMNNTAGKFRRIASESSLGRLLASGVRNTRDLSRCMLVNQSTDLRICRASVLRSPRLMRRV